MLPKLTISQKLRLEIIARELESAPLNMIKTRAKVCMELVMQQANFIVVLREQIKHLEASIEKQKLEIQCLKAIISEKSL